MNIKAKPIRPRLAGTIPQFVIGQEYNRRADIHLNYGGSRQNGASPSSVCPAIFLFTGDTGKQYGYHDQFDSADVFSFTGEGQLGDMVFQRGNLAIRDHAVNGCALHLFRSLGKSRDQLYLGEFVLANYKIHRGLDRENNDRDVIIFHLLRVDAAQESPEPSDAAPPTTMTLDEAKKRALAACAGSVGGGGKQAVRTVYERSKAVRDYVVMRAGGTCDACAKPAPFLGTDSKPYLEAHHTTRLSDGGVDHPCHVAALCPTCHREIHYGQNGFAVNRKLIDFLDTVEKQIISVSSAKIKSIQSTS